MILVYDEKLPTVFTASSLVANYPVGNLSDSRLSRIYRTADTVKAVDIVWDLGSAIEVGGIGIANHNLSSAAVVTLEGNSTDVWTSPSYSSSILWKEGTIISELVDTSLRYWRLVISDVTNSNDYLFIGRAYLGSKYVTPCISPTFSFERKSTSKNTRSLSGQTYMDERYFYSTITTTFPVLTHEEKNDIISIFEVQDIGNPFFVYVDELEEQMYYCNFDGSSLKATLLGNRDYHTIKVMFIEEV